MNLFGLNPKCFKFNPSPITTQKKKKKTTTGLMNNSSEFYISGES